MTAAGENFWGVRGDNPPLIRKIYTPPSGKETTHLSRIFDLVHLWCPNSIVSIFVLQGLRYEGSGVSAKNFKYLIHARMLKRRTYEKLRINEQCYSKTCFNNLNRNAAFVTLGAGMLQSAVSFI